MNVTQDMYNVTLQQQRTIYIKANLLNFQFMTVNELSGVVIDYSLSQSATSDIRRTCDITMCVKDSGFEIKSGSQIWLDKYIQIHIGIEDFMTDKIVWFNKGIYLINQPSLSYNATDNTLSFSGVDLMAKMTGLRNGQLEAVDTEIKAKSKIREVIINTIKLGGFDKYIINIKEGQEEVPIDLKIDSGATIYDILDEIRNIYVNYQMYFDENGVFHYEPIPNGDDEIVKVTSESFDLLAISHDVATDFEKVKNVIEVLGKTHEPPYYSDTTLSGDVYSANIAGLNELNNDTIIGVTLHNIVTNPKLKVNSFSAYPIVNSDEKTPSVIPEKDTYYVVQYKDNKFIFLGHLQAHAVIKDENPNSPFYVKSSVGEIRKICSGSDYDNIPSDELAMERAKFELYHSARLQDSINIECVPIYYLNVYDLIEFKVGDDTEPTQFIVQDINESETQSISASKYYPFYPII